MVDRHVIIAAEGGILAVAPSDIVKTSPSIIVTPLNVQCRERIRKAPPKCPACHRAIQYCPHTECGKEIIATEEKGVDTLIATDMIRLAWENAYDLAVLATSDSDLVPAVEFLNLKGRKIIQAGFPPKGVDLATACWASFDVAPHRAEIRRARSPSR